MAGIDGVCMTELHASAHLRGLDVFRLSLPEVVGAQELPHLNPQLQE
jgi:hypothetical protein